ncbi:YciI family protein [Flindersiella endophytica]
MKYMLLIYTNPENTEPPPSETEQAEVFAEVDAIMAELMESGEWIGGEALADASQSKTIHVRGGVAAVTDGPFLETKEQFAGYCLFEVASLERALDIAARWPDARNQGVELRPLMTDNGTEM